MQRSTERWTCFAKSGRNFSQPFSEALYTYFQGYAESFIKDEHAGPLARELLNNLEQKFK